MSDPKTTKDVRELRRLEAEFRLIGNPGERVSVPIDRDRYEAIYGAVSDEFRLRWKSAQSVAEYEAVSVEAQAEIDRRYANVKDA